jgi:hypothetical protein
MADTLTAPTPAGQVEQYIHLLTRSNRLIPLTSIPTVRRVIEAALVPAAPEELGKALAVVNASFKWPSAEVIEDRDAYLVAMGVALKSYPYQVLIDTIREATCVLKWIPAISELIELADKRTRLLRKALLRLDRMPSEHRQIQRAQAAAEQKSAEAAERYGQIEREFTAQFGPLPPGDFRSAWFAMSVLPCHEREREAAWTAAIRRGDRGAREAAKFMAIMGYLVMAVHEKLISHDELECLIEGDLETARNRVRELGVNPPGGPEWFLHDLEYRVEQLLDPCGGAAISLSVEERYEGIRKRFTRPRRKIAIDRL